MNTIEVISPRGNPATLAYRDDTSDLSTIGSTWRLWGNLEDEYGLQNDYITGTAIDIGAHIGSIAFAVLADNPEAKVIAVEPLSENVAVIRETAQLNGWTDRLRIIEGAIGTGKTTDVAFLFSGDDNLWNHRYIGGMLLGHSGPHELTTVPTVYLSDLIGDGIPFLKVDCEGCEWDLFADPAIAKVQTIVGEGHPQDWLKRVRKALGKTHTITVITDEGGPGTFRAVAK